MQPVGTDIIRITQINATFGAVCAANSLAGGAFLIGGLNFFSAVNAVFGRLGSDIGAADMFYSVVTLVNSQFFAAFGTAGGGSFGFYLPLVFFALAAQADIILRGAMLPLRSNFFAAIGADGFLGSCLSIVLAVVFHAVIAFVNSQFFPAFGAAAGRGGTLGRFAIVFSRRADPRIPLCGAVLITFGNFFAAIGANFLLGFLAGLQRGLFYCFSYFADGLFFRLGKSRDRNQCGQ